ncbi:hypothetical protein Adt_31352 [Abeliophyllum distichum]|uniref:Uncharacterized protein n=1 Tax=Abeliophyllum distichum TaxID=126358 RepID=A0ABD1RF51_9LAMI
MVDVAITSDEELTKDSIAQEMTSSAWPKADELNASRLLPKYKVLHRILINNIDPLTHRSNISDRFSDAIPVVGIHEFSNLSRTPNPTPRVPKHVLSSLDQSGRLDILENQLELVKTQEILYFDLVGGPTPSHADAPQTDDLPPAAPSDTPTRKRVANASASGTKKCRPA